MSGSRNDGVKVRIAISKRGDRGHSKNMKMTWGELRDRLASPVVDRKYTLPEYLELPTDRQNKLKDVGSFTGGPFEDGLRRKISLQYRSVLTLDIDSATSRQIRYLKSGLSDACEFEFFGSTTRKHSKKKPRWRLVFPMTRRVELDEYAPLSRIVASTVFETIQESMDAVDDVSFRPAQIMYWPSHCKDALFETLHNEGRLLDPDAVLDGCGFDWTDWTKLPFSEKRGQKRPSGEKAEHPHEKPGYIGAFCRAYSIEDAIDAFLPEIYSPGDEHSLKPRYTYMHGTSSNGAVVEDDGLFLYSHHGSDPCAEQLVNAFDMVRIHLYGELDSDAPFDATPTELPSFKAMVKMLKNDEATIAELDDDYHEYQGPTFQDLGDEDDDEDEPPRKKDKKSKKTAESHVDVEEDEEPKKKSGPDLSLLRQSVLEAPDFPVDLLGPFWAERIRFWAKAKSAPVDYPATALLVGAAALIGNSRRVAVHPEWVEPCILWGAVVGTPSSKKSPALDPIAAAFTELERDWIAPYQEELREWEAAKRIADKKRKIWEAKLDEQLALLDEGRIDELPEEFQTMPAECSAGNRPVPRRARVSDTTMEALLYNLSGNPRGFMAQHDELSAWYSSFTRYSGSSSTSDRAMWLEAFGGRSKVIDRVKHLDKPVSVPSFAVSLLGGIQPDRLGDFMKASDDGLQARFLYAWPEPIKIEYSLVEEEDTGSVNALRSLAELDMAIDKAGYPLPDVLPMSTKAREHFLRWSEARSEREKFESGLAAGAFGKSEGIVARLALVLEHLWWCADMFSDAQEPQRVSLKAVKAAIRLREDYFKPMQLRVFSHGSDDVRSDSQRILAWIVSNKLSEVTVRDVYKKVPRMYKKDQQAIKNMLNELVEAKWLQIADIDRSAKGGRPTARFIVSERALRAVKAA